jgi:hypothetical protein
LNDGNGNFTEESSPFIDFEGVSSSSILILDINNDNNKDILITGENSQGNSTSNLYVNIGNGTFSLRSNNPLPGLIGSTASADINNDGFVDILISGKDSNGENISKLYINNSGNSFSEDTDSNFVGLEKGSVAFADVDNDNDNDILITGSIRNRYTGNVSKSTLLYLNDGDGNFIMDDNIPFDSVNSSSVVFNDIDNDGDMDLLIAGSSFSKKIVKLYKNNSSSSLNINDINNQNYNLIVYPNPFDETLDFKISNSLNIKKINLFNINGQFLNDINYKSHHVDLSYLDSGIYILRVSFESGDKTSKLIIKK